jgi:pyridoxamine 5'-phosphate oxidase
MKINETLESLRVSYQASSLDAKDCDSDPLIQFDQWLQQAILSKCDEPNSFILSTVKNNRPRSRVVLLKGIHNSEFVFYTNYKSAKGDEIEKNENVALTFLWLPLQRQVRIEGKVTKVPETLSDEYFGKRPRGSQIGAIASPQSTILESRKSLEELFLRAEEKFEGEEKLPRPNHWGGYGITPDYIEFWQGRPNRMHDRICYEKDLDQWKIYRLAP